MLMRKFYNSPSCGAANEGLQILQAFREKHFISTAQAVKPYLIIITKIITVTAAAAAAECKIRAGAALGCNMRRLLAKTDILTAGINCIEIILNSEPLWHARFAFEPPQQNSGKNQVPTASVHRPGREKCSFSSIINL